MPRSPLVSGPRALVLRASAASLLVIGYADLVRGGTTVAPVALVLGYMVFVPLSFLVD